MPDVRFGIDASGARAGAEQISQQLRRIIEDAARAQQALTQLGQGGAGTAQQQARAREEARIRAQTTAAVRAEAAAVREAARERSQIERQAAQEARAAARLDAAARRESTATARAEAAAVRAAVRERAQAERQAAQEANAARRLETAAGRERAASVRAEAAAIKAAAREKVQAERQAAREVQAAAQLEAAARRQATASARAEAAAARATAREKAQAQRLANAASREAIALAAAEERSRRQQISSGTAFLRSLGGENAAYAKRVSNSLQMAAALGKEINTTKLLLGIQNQVGRVQAAHATAVAADIAKNQAQRASIAGTSGILGQLSVNLASMGQRFRVAGTAGVQAARQIQQAFSGTGGGILTSLGAGLASLGQRFRAVGAAGALGARQIAQAFAGVGTGVLTGLGAALGALGTRFRTAGAGAAQAGRQIQQAFDDARNSILNRWGRGMTRALTLPLTAAAAAAVKLELDFRTTFTKIQTVAEESAQGAALLREELLLLGPVVGKGPNELARALLVIESVGIKGADAMAILERSAKLAAIGLGDTAIVAKTVASAVLAFKDQNLTAADAADQLLVAVRLGGAEADAFAGTLGRVIAIAAQAGLTFAEVGGFVSTFTRLGVDADEAVTALRQSLNLLIKQPEKRVQEAFKAMGSSVQEFRNAVAEKGLAQAFIDLVRQVERSRTEVGEFIPNLRALAGVLANAGAQADEYAKNQFKIAQANEEVNRSFEITRQAGVLAFAQLKAAAETALIVFAEQTKLAQGVGAVAESLGKLLVAFRDLSAETKATIATTALLVLALGPLLRILKLLGTLFFGGAVAQGLKLFGAQLVLLIPRLGALGGAFATLLSFINPWVRVLLIAGGAILAYLKIQKELTEALHEVPRFTKEAGDAYRKLGVDIDTLAKKAAASMNAIEVQTEISLVAKEIRTTPVAEREILTRLLQRKEELQDRLNVLSKAPIIVDLRVMISDLTEQIWDVDPTTVAGREALAALTSQRDVVQAEMDKMTKAQEILVSYPVEFADISEQIKALGTNPDPKVLAALREKADQLTLAYNEALRTQPGIQLKTSISLSAGERRQLSITPSRLDEEPLEKIDEATQKARKSLKEWKDELELSVQTLGGQVGALRQSQEALDLYNREVAKAKIIQDGLNRALEAGLTGADLEQFVADVVRAAQALDILGEAFKRTEQTISTAKEISQLKFDITQLQLDTKAVNDGAEAIKRREVERAVAIKQREIELALQNGQLHASEKEIAQLLDLTRAAVLAQQALEKASARKSIEDSIKALEMQAAALRGQVVAMGQSTEAVEAFNDQMEMVKNILEATNTAQAAGIFGAELEKIIERTRAASIEIAKMRRELRLLAEEKRVEDMEFENKLLLDQIEAYKQGTAAIKAQRLEEVKLREIRRLQQGGLIDPNSAAGKRSISAAVRNAELQDMAEKQQELANETIKIWDNAIENIQRSFGDLFTGLILDGKGAFKEIGKSLKEMFARTIGEILAANLMAPLKNLLGGALGGAGGGAGASFTTPSGGNPFRQLVDQLLQGISGIFGLRNGKPTAASGTGTGSPTWAGSPFSTTNQAVITGMTKSFGQPTSASSTGYFSGVNPQGSPFLGSDAITRFHFIQDLGSAFASALPSGTPSPVGSIGIVQNIDQTFFTQGSPPSGQGFGLGIGRSGSSISTLPGSFTSAGSDVNAFLSLQGMPGFRMATYPGGSAISTGGGVGSPLISRSPSSMGSAVLGSLGGSFSSFGGGGGSGVFTPTGTQVVSFSSGSPPQGIGYGAGVGREGLAPTGGVDLGALAGTITAGIGGILTGYKLTQSLLKTVDYKAEALATKIGSALGGVVGAVFGGIFGGAGGASLGGMLGAVAGGALLQGAAGLVGAAKTGRSIFEASSFLQVFNRNILLSGDLLSALVITMLGRNKMDIGAEVVTRPTLQGLQEVGLQGWPGIVQETGLPSNVRKTPFGFIGLAGANTGGDLGFKGERGILETIESVDTQLNIFLSEVERQLIESSNIGQIHSNVRDSGKLITARIGAVLSVLGIPSETQAAVLSQGTIGAQVQEASGLLEQRKEILQFLNELRGLAEPVTESSKALEKIAQLFRDIAVSGPALGVVVDDLAALRDEAIHRVTLAFNDMVRDAIAGILEDPALASRELAKLQEQRLKEAIAIGGDIVQVERLHLLERKALLEQLNAPLQNMIDQIKFSPSGSSPSTALTNAESRFFEVRSGLLTGTGGFSRDDLAAASQTFLTLGEQFLGGPAFAAQRDMILSTLEALVLTALPGMAADSSEQLTAISFETARGNAANEQLLLQLIGENKLMREELVLLRADLTRQQAA